MLVYFICYLENFMVIRYILWPFGNVLVYCAKKNLATLSVTLAASLATEGVPERDQRPFFR
jgi:hypothetical protein